MIVAYFYLFYVNLISKFKKIKKSFVLNFFFFLEFNGGKKKKFSAIKLIISYRMSLNTQLYDPFVPRSKIYLIFL